MTSLLFLNTITNRLPNYIDIKSAEVWSKAFFLDWKELKLVSGWPHNKPSPPLSGKQDDPFQFVMTAQSEE